MSDMLCYVDQKPAISPSGEYNKTSHPISNPAIINHEFENRYAQSNPTQSMNPAVFNHAYHIPGSTSPTTTSMADIGQRMAPYSVAPSDYGQQARLHSTDGQAFGTWGQPFNAFGSIPPPIHIDRSFDWERQYQTMPSHPFPMQPPPFTLPSTTSSPNSCMDERSPDINGMPFGGQGFFVSSPNTMQQGHEMEESLHGIPSATSRRPYEWINKNSYQSLPPPPGKTRTKDKYRVVYTDHQRLELEKEFRFSRYITIRRKAELAGQLCLSERQVKIWFQNRRAKERKINKKKLGGCDQDDAQNASNDEDASSDDIKSNDIPSVNGKSSDDDSLDFSDKTSTSKQDNLPPYSAPYSSADIVPQHAMYPTELPAQKLGTFDRSPPVYGMAGECNVYPPVPVDPTMNSEAQFYMNQPNDDMQMMRQENGITLQSLDSKVCEEKPINTSDFHPTFVNGNKAAYQSA